jgi:dTDP-4-dehydrorhamnose reductase
MARLARERPELRVVDDQVGAPTSAALIADALAKIIGEEPGARRERWSAAGGLVHLAASGGTSWYGFAAVIVDGLRRRGVALKAEKLTPITTAEFPTRARRPGNSRFDLTRLKERFGIEPPLWSRALDHELDRLAGELTQA